MIRRWFFRFAYRGRPRWDTGVTPPELIELVEGDSALAPGRALDLGCGTGTNVIYLAKHGWDATGVDFVPAAVHAARQKRRLTGVRAEFVAGDVTRLNELPITGPFQFVLDIGCFHGIPSARRAGYARGVATLTATGATMLMFGFEHPPPAVVMRRGFGINAPELRRVFGSDFELAGVQPGTEPSPGVELHPAWYRLRRR
ncbi:MAG: class I SAM-dependent methyltransferase [Candidatus Dormibacteria bacterium]